MIRLLHEAIQFLWLVLTGWEQYAAAGVTSLLVYLFEKFKKSGLSWNNPQMCRGDISYIGLF